jgi:hypothetical protein
VELRNGSHPKAPSLLALNPNIAVVQECSKKSVDDLYSQGLSGLWFGANPNKGVAVFCSRTLTLQAANVLAAGLGTAAGLNVHLYHVLLGVDVVLSKWKNL